jgi:hypothetical protein
MLPYSAIALICISASIGRVPARMKTAGSATLIYSDIICFIHFLYKSHESLSWFIEIKELYLKYDIVNIYNYLENPLSKN